MQSNAPSGAAPQKKGMSPLAIVLVILGTLALLGIGTCVAGGLWLKGKAEDLASNLKDGGAELLLVAPPAVTTALAGPKSAYVGTWRSKAGSTLTIGADGHLSLDKQEGGATTKYNAPIAAFAGDDMEIKMFVKLTIAVGHAPHRAGDHWEMTADGIAFERK